MYPSNVKFSPETSKLQTVVTKLTLLWQLNWLNCLNFSYSGEKHSFLECIPCFIVAVYKLLSFFHTIIGLLP